MDDVSVILHSGVVSAIIRCVSHNLSSAVRKLHRVLTLRFLLGLALRVVVDIPRVVVRHVVREVIVCRHIIHIIVFLFGEIR